MFDGVIHQVLQRLFSPFHEIIEMLKGMFSDLLHRVCRHRFFHEDAIPYMLESSAGF
jgi:hypothetical protein